MDDYINITGLKIFANHGVLPEEKENGQDFFLNVKLYYDMSKPGKTDDLTDAVNYAQCCEYMTEVFTEKSFDLIEKAGEYLCERLLCKFDLIKLVELELRKPHAPIGLPFEDVSVNMKRSWHEVYISFGSNMGDKEKYIENGLNRLREHGLIKKVKVSSLIRTKPYGGVEQDDFINGCAKLYTIMNPEELLAFLHEIEAEANRIREVHWGPRTLDMDIVFYDKLVYESETLVIPHIDMQNRDFVLRPLNELCPNFRHPVLCKTVAQMLTELDDK